MSHKSVRARAGRLSLVWLALLMALTVPTLLQWPSADGIPTVWVAPAVAAPTTTLTPTPGWWATVLPANPPIP